MNAVLCLLVSSYSTGRCMYMNVVRSGIVRCVAKFSSYHFRMWRMPYRYRIAVIMSRMSEYSECMLLHCGWWWKCDCNAFQCRFSLSCCFTVAISHLTLLFCAHKGTLSLSHYDTTSTLCHTNTHTLIRSFVLSFTLLSWSGSFIFLAIPST